jgi:hypothetical protein
LKLVKQILEKEGINISAVTHVGDFQIVSNANRVIVAMLPTELYEKTKLIIKRKNDKTKFELQCCYQQHDVEISCDEMYLNNGMKIVRDSIREYFNGGVIDSINDYMRLDSSGFPNSNDLKNYPAKAARLYKYAMCGFKKEDNFRSILTGNPGTGKTYFSKILSKYLLENKYIENVIVCSPLNIKDIVLLIKTLKLKMKTLFIADEMELGSMDREFQTTKTVSEMLHILDGIDEIKNLRFLGITNLPQIMDRAMFRPGRIDLLIKSESSAMSEKFILNILKSLNLRISNIEILAEEIYKHFPQVMPISFYTQSARLYKIYNDIKVVVEILKIFYDNKKMFQYSDGLAKNSKMGFDDSRIDCGESPCSPGSGKVETL